MARVFYLRLVVYAAFVSTLALWLRASLLIVNAPDATQAGLSLKGRHTLQAQHISKSDLIQFVV